MHQELFDTVEKLVVSPSLDNEMFEVEAVAQMLYQLGYLKASDLNLDKKTLIKAINEGLHHSHLT